MSTFSQQKLIVSISDLEEAADSLYPEARKAARLLLKQVAKANQVSTSQPTLAVVGRFSAGKSCLLNTLIGNDILVVDTDLVRLGLCFMVYGEDVKYACARDTAEGQREWLRVDPHALRHEADANRQRSQSAPPSTDYRITAPADALRYVRLVDTPGYDSPSALIHPSWRRDWAENLILRACSIADVCILVLNNAADQADLDMVEKIAPLCPRVSLVISKSDTIPPSDLEMLADYNAETLQHALGHRPPVFCVSSHWQAANPARRSEMLASPPLSYYECAPRNDWHNLMWHIRREAQITPVWRALRQLLNIHRAVECVDAVQKQYDRRKQAAHVLQLRLAELRSAIDFDPLGYLDDAESAIRDGTAIPWGELALLGVRPSDLAPEMSLSHGPTSIVSTLLRRYEAILSTMLSTFGRDLSPWLRSLLDAELSSFDRLPSLSAETQSMLNMLSEWGTWLETTQGTTYAYGAAVRTLVARWGQQRETEQADVAWLLKDLVQLQT